VGISLHGGKLFIISLHGGKLFIRALWRHRLENLQYCIEYEWATLFVWKLQQRWCSQEYHDFVYFLRSIFIIFFPLRLITIVVLFLHFVIQIYLYTISVYLNTVLFKSLESVRSFKCFWKKSLKLRGCHYLIKDTVNSYIMKYFLHHYPSFQFHMILQKSL